MPKQPTEKQLAARKKFGEAAKARAAAKKDASPGPVIAEPQENDPDILFAKQPEQPVASDPGPMKDPEIDDLKRMVLELQAAMFRQGSQGNGVIAGNQGLVGTRERYIVDPGHYPTPVEVTTRMSKEPKLQPFAFDYNYELDYKMEVSSYETKDGVNTKEPRFELELRKIILDDDGTPTNGRYAICRGIFHEDPQAAIVVARQNGLEVDETNEQGFLNEMRYIRMRDWLLEAFYPSKIDQDVQQRKDMVVGGKIVQYFEVNSVNASSIPFKDLKNKL